MTFRCCSVAELRVFAVTIDRLGPDVLVVTVSTEEYRQETVVGDADKAIHEAVRALKVWREKRNG
jgi:hypothetical protein